MLPQQIYINVELFQILGFYCLFTLCVYVIRILIGGLWIYGKHVLVL